MKKGLLALFPILAGVVLALSIGSLGNTAKAAGEHKHCVCGAVHKDFGPHTEEEVDWKPVDVLPEPAEGGKDYVYLTKDITLTSQYTLKANQTLYICLNTHTIYQANGEKVRGFGVNNAGAHLVITDCQGTGSLDGSKNTSFNQTGSVVLVNGGGAVFDFYGGTLKNGNSKGSGGGVGLFNGTFNLLGGTITECQANSNGGSVYASGVSCTINIYKGTIEKGSATSGGNVFTQSGASVNVKGGEIKGGNAGTSSSGGNFLQRGAGALTIEGGVISGGTAKYGGSIAVSGSTLNVKPGAKIGGYTKDGDTVTRTGGVATAWGGNIYACKNGTVQSTVNISGGEIAGGSAPYGGNIFMYDNGTISMTDGTITGGIATGAATESSAYMGGGNVFCSSTFNMSGGTISNGTASNGSTGYGGNVEIMVKQSDVPATFTMTGGTMTGGSAKSMAANLLVADASPSYTVTSTATIKESARITNGLNYVFASEEKTNQPSITVQDGAFLSAYENTIISNRSLINVEGGTIIATRADGFALYLNNGPGTNASITGGYIAGGIKLIDGCAAANFVSGGHFTDEPAAEVLAAGKEAIPGTYQNPAAGDNRTYNFMVSDPVPYFTTNSVLLSGEIALNFYVKIPEAYRAGSYVEFTLNGVKTTDYFDATEMNGAGTYYRFTAPLTAIEMADEITAVFHSGEYTTEKTYSVVEYVNKVNANATAFEADELYLVNAILDYGHYMQLYLSNLRGWAIGTDHAEIPAGENGDFDFDEIATAVSGSVYEKQLPANVEKVTFSMSFDTTNTINVYIKGASGFTPNTVTVNGFDYTAEYIANSGRYRVRIEGLPAFRLNEEFTVVVNGDLTVKLSAMYYIKAQLDGSEIAKNAMGALYRFYEAASIYRNNRLV